MTAPPPDRQAIREQLQMIPARMRMETQTWKQMAIRLGFSGLLTFIERWADELEVGFADLIVVPEAAPPQDAQAELDEIGQLLKVPEGGIVSHAVDDLLAKRESAPVSGAETTNDPRLMEVEIQSIRQSPESIVRCPRCWHTDDLLADRPALSARVDPRDETIRVLREALEGFRLKGQCFCGYDIQREGLEHDEDCQRATAALAAASTEKRETQ